MDIIFISILGCVESSVWTSILTYAIIPIGISLSVTFLVISFQTANKSRFLLQQVQMYVENSSLSPCNLDRLHKASSDAFAHFFNRPSLPFGIGFIRYIFFKIIGIFWHNCMWMLYCSTPREFDEWMRDILGYKVLEKDGKKALYNNPEKLGTVYDENEVFAVRLSRVAELLEFHQTKDFNKKLQIYLDRNDTIWNHLKMCLFNNVLSIIILLILIMNIAISLSIFILLRKN